MKEWSYVYVVGGDAAGPHKVGISNGTIGRLAYIQHHCGQRVEIAYEAFRPDGDARLVEQLAHAILWAKRTVGEWFDVSRDEAICAVKEAEAFALSGNTEILNQIPKPVATTQKRRGKADADKDDESRKSVTMPRSMWRDIAQFQTSERIATEAEALRRVVIAGLRALVVGEKK